MPKIALHAVILECVVSGKITTYAGIAPLNVMEIVSLIAVNTAASTVIAAAERFVTIARIHMPKI